VTDVEAYLEPDRYADILVSRADAVVTVVLNRPDTGNRFRRRTTRELADAFRGFRDDPRARVAVLTGAGDRFFCIGGEHEPLESAAPSAALPIVDVYELIDTVPKPVVAAVNGFAVGGGNVLHVVCDLSIAADTAVFRQVGPLVGSFDAGYGSWYLEDTVGRKRAKEMWFLNRKYSATQALAMGLVNEVVPAAELAARAAEVAAELATRGPLALAGLKGAFSGRHSGVAGQARLAHDQLLTYYLRTDEAAAVHEAFERRTAPDPARFLR
jgi:naphthoate synthase